MKKPSRFLNVLGAISLILSLLVVAFGTATVSAQEESGVGQIADFNQDGDFDDYEQIADDGFITGANQWMNTSPAELVTWADGDCLVVDIDDDGEIMNIYPSGYEDGGAPGIPGGTYPGEYGGNLDPDPVNCTGSESEETDAIVDVVVPTRTGATTVTIVRANAGDDCSQLDYDSPYAVDLTYDGGDDTYERLMPQGAYCAQTDVAGDGSGEIYTSLEPFSISAGDPDESVAFADETLGPDSTDDDEQLVFSSPVSTSGDFLEVSLLSGYSFTVGVTNPSTTTAHIGTIVLTQTSALGVGLGTCDLSGAQETALIPAGSTVDVTFTTDCLFGLSLFLSVEAGLYQDDPLPVTSGSEVDTLTVSKTLAISIL